jgi:hypothetical protein
MKNILSKNNFVFILLGAVLLTLLSLFYTFPYALNSNYIKAFSYGFPLSFLYNDVEKSSEKILENEYNIEIFSFLFNFLIYFFLLFSLFYFIKFLKKKEILYIFLLSFFITFFSFFYTSSFEFIVGRYIFAILPCAGFPIPFYYSIGESTMGQLDFEDNFYFLPFLFDILFYFIIFTVIYFLFRVIKKTLFK